MKRLILQHPVTDQGARPSKEILEVLDSMRRAIEALEARVKALEP